MNPTPQQYDVIHNRGGNLLVSAAAGAGKTTVLVDRILSRILDEGQDISRFLIITFTNDAAAQLRSRISRRIAQRLEEDPDNESLLRQARLVHTAQISTVHAFCGELLKDCAAEANLPPDFRIADENECSVLQASAMQQVLEEVYEKAPEDPGLTALLNLIPERELEKTLLKVHASLQSHTWPEQWAQECLEQLQAEGVTDISETIWGGSLMQSTREKTRHLLRRLDEAILRSADDPAVCMKCSPVLKSDRKRLQQIAEASDSWTDLAELKGSGELSPWMRWTSPPRSAGENAVQLGRSLKDTRDQLKKDTQGLVGEISSEPSDEALEDVRRTVPAVRSLFAVTRRFAEVYGEKKLREGVLDFSDLEHGAVNLLLDPVTKEPTRTAKTVAGRYAEILVDEYQDTNEVQEAIFNAISDGTNLFMVGDVKQSIYGFRLADPTIFLRQAQKSRPHTEAAPGEPRRISLTCNFRSRPGILDAVNTVMRTCMSPEAGEVEYTDEEALIPGRVGELGFPPLAAPCVELDVLMTSKEDGEDSGVSDWEPRYVAERIRDMIGREYVYDDREGRMRPVRAGDISIIMRAANRSGGAYAEALAGVNIPSRFLFTGDLLQTDEILTMISFLQILDSPLQDIPLAGVLTSPLFQFTPEDMAQVRLCGQGPFLRALRSAAGSMPKAEQFLDVYDQLKILTGAVKPSELYYAVLEKTSAPAIYRCCPNGEQREANLYEFGAVITDFENQGGKGLRQLLSWLRILPEGKLPQAAVGTGSDAVTITTVHGSKGLEYPVVFLPDLSRKFNRMSSMERVLMDRTMGAGVCVYEPEGRYIYPGVAYQAIQKNIDRVSKSEELRILYVAMTRAQHRLVMTCTCTEKKLEQLAKSARSPMDPADVLRCTCPGDWILSTALTLPESDPLWQEMHGGPGVVQRQTGEPWRIRVEHPVPPAADQDDAQEPDPDTFFPAPDREQLRRQLTFQYAYGDASRTRASVSPTGLGKVGGLPRISFQQYGAKSASAAEKGTAAHLFMRYADFQLCASRRDGVDREIERMVKGGFLLKEDVSAINVPMLRRFFASPLGQRMAQYDPASMHREFSFAVQFPACDVLPDTASADPVTINGIVDCYVETPDGIVFFDYKTDRVRDDADVSSRVKKYTPQLTIYAKALEAICGRPVKEKFLIFLQTGQAVPV